MRRYWVDPSYRQEEVVLLAEEIFHHICGVCRQGVGDQFEVLFGDGQAHLVEIIEIHKKQALAKYVSVRKIEALPEPHIHLVLSVPRFPVLEKVLEKSVELGVHSVHPFFSDFSFIQDPKKLSESKLKRWKKIILGATQQCGRGELMNLEEFSTKSEIFQNFNRQTKAAGLFCYEGESSQDIRSALKALNPTELEQIWIFVGGEGGFSKSEVEEFQTLGLSPLTLGPQVLRVETACLALTSIIKYELGLMV